jgi:hypothetical protein
MSNSTESNAGAGMTDSERLYDIVSRLAALEGTLRTFMETWRDQDTAAGLARRVVHERLELQGLQIDRVAKDVLNVQQDVAELKNDIEDTITPTINAVKAKEQRSIGARSILAMLWTGVTAVLATFAYMAERLVSYLTTRP